MRCPLPAARCTLPPHLLVSVAGAADARAALEGGADVIDAKDPAAGALGAVAFEVLQEIHAAVGGRRPVTAALGDAIDEGAVERAAHDFAAAGAALVKVGFAGVTSARQATALTRAAVRGAESGAGAHGGVVAVAYADAGRVGSLAPGRLVAVAAAAGARGVLLDTADKQGPGLLTLLGPAALAGWVAEAHRASLLAALAGKLTAADLPVVAGMGPDVIGVRGAACEGGRAGHVSAERVRLLRALCAGARERPPGPPADAPGRPTAAARAGA